MIEWNSSTSPSSEAARYAYTASALGSCRLRHQPSQPDECTVSYLVFSRGGHCPATFIASIGAMNGDAPMPWGSIARIAIGNSDDIYALAFFH